MLFTGCEEVVDAIEEELDKQELFTGLDTETEAMESAGVPKDLSLVTLSNGTLELASEAGLYDFIPPVKSQGQYGTCTSWATGYYARTIMHARENDLSASDLNDPTNVFSPLDIYLSIPHGPDCGGSAICTAFKTMQERGIAKLADVPYENLGDCSQKSPAGAQQYQAGKINHYRRVDANSVEELKTYIQRGCPIAIGCKMGDNTSYYKGGVVMDDTAPRAGGHAMCLVGYDDDKGPNGAFCIVNSWGNTWGEDGFMWVDYNFFTAGTFCRYAYVIEADKGTPPLVDANIINPEVRVEGKDLLTINLEDRTGDVTDYKPNPGPRDRSVQYNVFNKGKQAISASEDWSILYYYYNAFDPENDFGIVFYDYYTDDVAGEAAKGQAGDFNDLNTPPTAYGQWNWWNYIDVPAGYSVGKALDNGQESDMVIDYELPANLNGEYYFVLFADGFCSINEKHEQNNFMFFTGKDRKPIQVTNGVIQSNSLKCANGSIEPATYIDGLKRKQPNAYSQEEVAGLIRYQKKHGILKAAAQRHQMKLKNGTLSRSRKRFVPASN